MLRLDKKGFTLIELMVSVSIFASVAVIATGAILTANSLNKKAQAIKLVVDNLNFALDSMTLKMKRGGGYYCASFTDNPPSYPVTPDSQDCPAGNTAVAFKLEDGTQYIYRINNSRLELSQGGGFGGMSSFMPITAEEVVIQGGRFYVTGNGSASDQPKILIGLYGVARAGRETSTFAVATAASDRR